MKRLALGLTLAAACAAPLSAETSDVLILRTAEQGVLQRLTGAGDMTAITRGLERRGFEVSLAANADSVAMRAAFSDYLGTVDARTDSVAMFITGRIVSTISGSYLLPAAASDRPSLAQVLTGGFPLDSLYALAAGFPGRALIVIGEVEIDDALAPGLSADIPSHLVPQGVTVAIGPVANADRLLGRLANATGQDVLALARNSGLSLQGFVPQELVLMPEQDISLPQITPPNDSGSQAAADAAAWQVAQSTDTAAAYETYLAAFPQGASAAEARQRLTAIRSDPFYREKEIEDALALSRDARREIQRDLSLLGYNTRGIDGIFGRGTRGAVTAWQTDNGLPASGYLSSDQIARLDAQAERRAAELEEEARQRQAQLERQDRAFWAETGARGDEAGFRAYLKRFPDGLFSAVAEDRLEIIEEQRRAQAESQDAARWQIARNTDTEAGYRAYLAERPNGAFAEEARARIEWIRENSGQREVEAQAQADEAALSLNPGIRRLAEARLADLGLEPGRVDGVFDAETRRAIRRFQDARKLRVSGYLDQATVVRLMADTILR